MILNTQRECAQKFTNDSSYTFETLYLIPSLITQTSQKRWRYSFVFPRTGTRAHRHETTGRTVSRREKRGKKKCECTHVRVCSGPEGNDGREGWIKGKVCRVWRCLRLINVNLIRREMQMHLRDRQQSLTLGSPLACARMRRIMRQWRVWTRMIFLIY